MKLWKKLSNMHSNKGDPDVVCDTFKEAAHDLLEDDHAYAQDVVMADAKHSDESADETRLFSVTGH